MQKFCSSYAVLADFNGTYLCLRKCTLKFTCRDFCLNDGDYYSAGASESEPITGVLPGPRFGVMNFSSAPLKPGYEISTDSASCTMVSPSAKSPAMARPWRCDDHQNWRRDLRATARARGSRARRRAQSL